MQTIERRGTPRIDDPYRIEDGHDGNPRVRGYAAVFGSPSHDMGGFVEVIEPTAFERAMGDNPDVVCLFNHDPDHLLARTASGTLELAMDLRGLSYSFEPPDTTLGRDLKVLMERGDIVGSSFAFVIADGGQRFEENEDGSFVRYISECERLIDVSIVTTPAYPDTSVAVRSLEDWKRQNVVHVPFTATQRWHMSVARSMAARARIGGNR